MSPAAKSILVRFGVDSGHRESRLLTNGAFCQKWPPRATAICGLDPRSPARFERAKCQKCCLQGVFALEKALLRGCFPIWRLVTRSVGSRPRRRREEPHPRRHAREPEQAGFPRRSPSALRQISGRSMHRRTEADYLLDRSDDEETNWRPGMTRDIHYSYPRKTDFITCPCLDCNSNLEFAKDFDRLWQCAASLVAVRFSRFRGSPSAAGRADHSRLWRVRISP